MTDEESRKAFEAHVSRGCFDLSKDEDGYYLADATHWMWGCWKAAVARMQLQQEWRSMDSAPKGGEMILCHNGAEHIVAGWDVDASNDEDRWYTHDGHYHDKEFIGWLPLPPVTKEAQK
jgi:hypothetical protein